MEELLTLFQTNQGMGLGIATAIFLLTLILTAKRFIGFALTVILLLIALGAGWTAANQDQVRTYIDTQTTP